MKKTSTYIAILLLAAALILPGCARPPTEEMNNAIEAVTMAENDANAVRYAGSTLARAQEALRRMHSESDARNFDAARVSAAEAAALASRAISEGQTWALRTREEASALLLALRPEADQTEQSIRAAQAAGLDLDYAELGRNLETARMDLARGEVALAGNRYNEALERGRDTRIGLNDINQRLTMAATVVSAKR